MGQVTTRTGDEGFTGLLGAERVPKFDDRIEALGLVDEATSALGVARASATDARIRQIILDQQQTLYRLMAELATTSAAVGRLSVAPIGEADVVELERVSAELKADVEIGNRFVIPGETLSGATIDLARTIVRRAERQIVRMLHDQVVQNGELVRYLNRLSDTLFILARFVERRQTREVR